MIDGGGLNDLRIGTVKPSSPVVGTRYFDPHQQTMQQWNGSSWDIVVPTETVTALTFFESNRIEYSGLHFSWGVPEKNGELYETINNQVEWFLTMLDDNLSLNPPYGVNIDQILNGVLGNLHKEIETEIQIPFEIKVHTMLEPNWMKTKIMFSLKMSPRDVSEYEDKAHKRNLSEALESIETETKTVTLDVDSPEVTRLLRESAKSIGW